VRILTSRAGGTGSSSLRVVALCLLAAAAVAGRGAEGDAPSQGEGKNCLGEARPKLLLAEGVAFQSNPLGIDDQLQLGGCAPLSREPGPLFEYTNLQAGLFAEVSPVYAMPGFFVSVAPLSVLELRAEVEAVRVWTIGRDGSGYFPLPGPDASFSHLPAEQARRASGATAALTATAQVELPVAGRWSVAAADSASYAWWRLGDAAYYYHPRYDLVMARDDGIGRNTAVLLAGNRLSDRLLLRGGLTDELTWVKSSGYHQNLAGLLAAATLSGWPRPGDQLEPFLRAAVFTEHAFRRGQFQLAAGATLTFDLTPGKGGR